MTLYSMLDELVAAKMHLQVTDQSRQYVHWPKQAYIHVHLGLLTGL